MKKTLVLLAVMLTFSIYSFAQQQVTGEIKDEKGKGIPFVNISVKGKAGGVVSNQEGNYNISIVKDDILVYSFIGFKTQEIKVKGKKVIDVTLIASQTHLKEVFVSTGYQKIERERMTGAVSIVGAAKIRESGATTIEEVLRGSMSGVNVSSLTGEPGVTSKIRIRGLNGLTGDMNPVWILDGIRISSGVPRVGNVQNALLTDGIGDISPEDIESITVLKDAAATAIYGAQAANGVIIITTKKGVPGKTRVTANIKHFISEAPKNKLDLMNSREKLDYEDGLFEDFANQKVLNTPYINMLKQHREGIVSDSELQEYRSELASNNDDFFKHIYRQAKSSSYGVSLSGGTEQTTFYGSLNYSTTEGTLINNTYNVLGGRFNLDHKFNDKLKLFTEISTSRSESENPSGWEDVNKYLTRVNPYVKIYNEDGSYAYDIEKSIYSDGRFSNGYQKDLIRGYNLVEDMKSNTSKNTRNSSIIKAKLNYNPIKDLEITVLGGYSYSTAENTNQSGSQSYRAYKENWAALSRNYHLKSLPLELAFGSKRQSLLSRKTMQLRSTISYIKKYQKHQINAFVGQEVIQQEDESFFNKMPIYNEKYEMGLYPNFFSTDLIKTFRLDQLGSTAKQIEKSSAFFVKLDYTFDEKYVISYNSRWDGASIIGNKNNFTPLQTYGFRWNASKESFIENLNIFDDLAFRASYGYTGMIDRSALPFTVLKFGGSQYYESTLLPTSVSWANPNIKWQKKLDRTLGLDARLLNNRLELVVDYYNNETRDLLDSKAYPISTGKGSVRANVASVKNTGYELAANIHAIDKKDWSLRVNFNISQYKNEISESEVSDITEFPTMTKYARSLFLKGDSHSSIYGYNFAGIDPQNGHTLLYAQKDRNIHDYMIHSTKNGRDIIDADATGNFHKACITKIGNREPTMSGGFGMLLKYKQLTLSSSFSYMAGFDILSMEANLQANGLFDGNRNTTRATSSRWRKPGDITNQGPLDWSGVQNRPSKRPAYNQYMYDKHLSTGDFIKCTNLSLGYRLPPALLNKLQISNAVITLGAQNVFTLTKFNGLDPETQSYSGYPNPRKFNLSINLSL